MKPGGCACERSAFSLSIATANDEALPDYVTQFERSIELCAAAIPSARCSSPWDDAVPEDFAVVERDWAQFRRQWLPPRSGSMAALRADATGFTTHIDAFVAAIESHMSRWTALLHLLQVVMMTLAVLCTAVLVCTGYRFVLEPMGQLKEATEKIQRGDFGARVQRITSDEFGTLATGFDSMAEHLQSMYRNLEAKVAGGDLRTAGEAGAPGSALRRDDADGEGDHTRRAHRSFTRHVGKVARADGVALRWSDKTNQRFLLLASEGLPAAMIEGEQCIRAATAFAARRRSTPTFGHPHPCIRDPGMRHCTRRRIRDGRVDPDPAARSADG